MGKQHHASGNWLNHGGDIYNRRYAETETKISPSTASNLRLKWKFDAGKDISATPAIYKGTIYFPSYNGFLYAVNAGNGSLVWKQNLKEITGINGTMLLRNVTTTVARATPTVAAGDDMLILGITGPAYVVAVKRTTGKLIWKTKLDSHPYAAITMSGTYHNG